MFAAAIGNGPPSGPFGDINCDGAVNILDAFALMRTEVGLNANQNQPCSIIGS